MDEFFACVVLNLECYDPGASKTGSLFDRYLSRTGYRKRLPIQHM
jgi:hypothetical protein